MSLDVIGAGFGRTGTKSLKDALEQLGFGPCHHMAEVLPAPGGAEPWAAAAEGQAIDWDAVFAGYRSAVDWPAAGYWQELSAHYPAAKVILTVRDPESWFRSTQETIFGPVNRLMSSDPSAVGRMMRAISDRHFGGRHNDRAACLAGYAANDAAVRREIAPERLLVFDVADGWEPLCAFLDVPVPATPFPRTNTTDEFRTRAAEMMARAAAGGPGR